MSDPRPGWPAQAAAIGVILLDADISQPAGDIGNAATFGYRSRTSETSRRARPSQRRARGLACQQARQGRSGESSGYRVCWLAAITRTVRPLAPGMPNRCRARLRQWQRCRSGHICGRSVELSAQPSRVGMGNSSSSPWTYSAVIRAASSRIQRQDNRVEPNRPGTVHSNVSFTITLLLDVEACACRPTAWWVRSEFPDVDHWI
jgi:hypothetical protein